MELGGCCEENRAPSLPKTTFAGLPPIASGSQFSLSAFGLRLPYPCRDQENLVSDELRNTLRTGQPYFTEIWGWPNALVKRIGCAIPHPCATVPDVLQSIRKGYVP
jgi:hypothetical protein